MYSISEFFPAYILTRTIVFPLGYMCRGKEIRIIEMSLEEQHVSES